MDGDFRLGDWLIRPQLNRIQSPGGQTTSVEPKAMEVLVYLARHSREVLPRERILQAVWPDTFVTDDVLAHAVSELRKAFGDEARNPRVILTIPRRGYRLMLPADFEAGPEQAGGSRRRERVWMSMALVLLAGLITALLLFYRQTYRQTPTGLERSVRYFLPSPEGIALQDAPVVSPDGKSVLYVGLDSAGKAHIYLQPLDSLEVRQLYGTEGAGRPFWSPDSDWIAFFSEDQLKRLAVAGGPPETIADPGGGGWYSPGCWNRDGIILFRGDWQVPLYRVPAFGGDPTPVTELDVSRNELSHRFPFFLPDGRHFLYTSYTTAWASTLCIGSLVSKEVKRLLEVESNAVYVPQGYLLFVRGGILLAQPFDAERLQVTGEPRVVADEVVSTPTWGFGPAFSASPEGVLAYRTGGARPRNQLVWYDRQGRQMDTVTQPGYYSLLSLSWDEKRIGVTLGRPGLDARDIWLIDPGRDYLASRFTSDSNDDCMPVFSPDGRRVAFISNRTGEREIYVKLADSPTETEPAARRAVLVTDWSADGRYLVYNNGGISVAAVVNGGEGSLMLEPPGYEYRGHHGTLSPDGKWIAYTSDESGRPEVYVESHPPGFKRQISTDGGAIPRWRRDGVPELFYLRYSGNPMGWGIHRERELVSVMVVRIDVDQGTFQAGVPVKLFEFPYDLQADYCYAPTADGQRFLVIQNAEERTPVRFVIDTNWLQRIRETN